MSWLQNDHYFFDWLRIHFLHLQKQKQNFEKFWGQISIDHFTLLHTKINISCGWNTFYKIFLKNLAQDSILVLISEWHIFSWFLAILMIKVFLTVVNEYAKNQKNTGHFVVISISATYGEMAAKISQNNLNLVSIDLYKSL